MSDTTILQNSTHVIKPKKSVALSGVPAGNTALCTVDPDILSAACRAKKECPGAPGIPKLSDEYLYLHKHTAILCIGSLP